MKYRVLIAAAFGTFVASSLVLLINLLGILAMLFLTPGGVLLSALAGSENPFAILAANALFYSLIAYVAVSVVTRRAAMPTLRRVALSALIPALGLAAVACIPSLNPISAERLQQVQNREAALRVALPVGTGLDRARVVLSASDIVILERIADDVEELVREGTTMNASKGERWLLATVLPEYLCAEQIQVTLLFAHDGTLKQQHFKRFRLCP